MTPDRSPFHNDEWRKPPHASWWVRLGRWLGLEPEQPTCIWCRGCGNEMISCIGSVYRELKGGYWEYTCRCGSVSVWDFYMPAPVLVKFTIWEDR